MSQKSQVAIVWRIEASLEINYPIGDSFEEPRALKNKSRNFPV
jgi:hypothetical protein